MEYVEGEDLLDSIARRSVLPEDEVLGIGIGIAAALAFADQHDVVHRDVKSANILLGRNGDVKLSDLGFAWQRGKGLARLTQAGCVVGTPFYISPEQALGETELDIRSDLYSLGICMYEALSGRVPFSHPNAFEVMCQHVNNAPPPLCKRRPRLRPETYAVIDRLLHKDPNQRYPNAESLAEALQAILLRRAERPIAVPSKKPAPLWRRLWS
jgi:serine/threonine protein kinase